MNLRKSLFVLAMGMGVALAADGKKLSDPVLMTIDGKDVRLSEFDYLYGKNNMQQQSPVAVDEYRHVYRLQAESGRRHCGRH